MNQPSTVSNECEPQTDWYIAFALQVFEPVEANCEEEKLNVYENAYLISAYNGDEAYSKAIEICARESGTECSDTDGRKFITVTKGLRDLVRVFDALEDGAELFFEELSLTKSEIRNRLTTRENLTVFIEERERANSQ